MKVKLGDLDKGTAFIRQGICYKKLNDKWSGRTTQEDGGCVALSQYSIYSFFENNSLVEVENGTKGISSGKRTNKQSQRVRGPLSFQPNP